MIKGKPYIRNNGKTTKTIYKKDRKTKMMMAQSDVMMTIKNEIQKKK